MAPQTPQRSERPGEAGALLDSRSSIPGVVRFLPRGQHPHAGVDDIRTVKTARFTFRRAGKDCVSGDRCSLFLAARPGAPRPTVCRTGKALSDPRPTKERELSHEAFRNLLDRSDP